MRNKQIVWDSEVNLGGNAVIGAGTSAEPDALITRAEVAGLVGDTNWKKPGALVATVATAPWTTTATASFLAPTLTITGLGTGVTLGLIDGVEPAEGDRILIKDGASISAGADAALNGLWEVTGGTTTSLTLERPDDADTVAKLISAVVIVDQGTSAGQIWVQTEAPVVIDVDPVNWSLPSTAPDAADVVFDNSGTGISGTDVQAAVEELDTRATVLEAGPFTIDSIEITSTDLGAGANREVGDTVSEITFTVAYSQTLASADLVSPAGDGEAGGTFSVVLPAEVFTYTATAAPDDTFTETAIGATAEFSVEAEDEFGRTTSEAVLLTWLPRIFYGPAEDPAPVDETFVEGLLENPLAASQEGDFTVTAGANQYIYFCYPDSFGDPTFFSGGLPGGFEADPNTPTLNITNANGVTLLYRVYRSENTGLGETTFTVEAA